MKVKFTLSIGFASAVREEVIEIDDAEWNACTNESQRNELMQQYWEGWADGYIDGGYEAIK